MDPLNFFINVKGRYVTGDHDKLRTLDHERKPIEASKQSYDWGVAFPKNDVWAWMAGDLWTYLCAAFANDADGMGRLQQWFQAPGSKGIMSMKIIDGDLPNREGKVNENTAGCFVFYLTSFGTGVEGANAARMPDVVAGPSADKLVQIPHTDLKRGDYVTIAGSLKPNGNSGANKGIYLNAFTIWKLEDGPAISGGGDPTAAFGGASIGGTYDPSQGAGAQFGAPSGTSYAPAAPQTPGSAPAAPAMPAQGMPGAQTAAGPSGGANPPAAPQMPGAVPTQPPAPGGAPAPAPTGHAAPPAPGGVPGAAPGGTASPGNAPQMPGQAPQYYPGQLQQPPGQ